MSVVFSQSPSIRYVLLGLNPAPQGRSYAVIVDREGRPVWYKEFPGSVFDFQKHGNSSYTVWSSSGPMSPFQQLDILGNMTDLYVASNGLETGLHELRMIGSDFALFGVEYRFMDLSALGGLPNARVRGLVVEYHRVGQPPFFWNTFDHLSVTDAAPDVPLNGPNVNPWHGNAIDIDAEGNLIVSFRNSDEVTKIDSRTGATIWRLGGRNNEFSFVKRSTERILASTRSPQVAQWQHLDVRQRHHARTTGEPGGRIPDRRINENCGNGLGISSRSSYCCCAARICPASFERKHADLFWNCTENNGG